MPFRVELELKSKSARALWVKAIGAFHTISDSFKIVIRQGTDTGYDEHGRKCYSEVVFTTMNKTKTTVLNTSFRTCFFKTFNIDGDIEEGSRVANYRDRENTNNCAKIYTMIVNSQDMNILFRDCGEDAISWRIFMLSGSEIEHMVYSNKLFVEFDSKSEMKKKYSIVYRPGINTFDTKIHYIYLKTLDNQKRADEKEANRAVNGFRDEDGNDEEEDEDFFADDDLDDDRVHRFAIDSIIFKRFLQTFPTLLEDFRIEINSTSGIIGFKGYNRQSILSRIDNIEKKPMTLGIQIKLQDIVYNNVKSETMECEDGRDGKSSKEKGKHNPDKKMEVSFRLKNFKTFIQIISGNLSTFQDDDDGERKSVYDRARSVSHLSDVGGFDNDDNICDVMFSKPGYPIIFERRYFKDGDNELLECCSVTLTEVTDGESGKIMLEAITNNQTVSHNALFDRSSVRTAHIESRLASVDVDAEKNIRREANLDVHAAEPLFVAEDNDYDGFEERHDPNDDNNHDRSNDENFQSGRILGTNQSEENERYQRRKRSRSRDDVGDGAKVDGVFDRMFWNNSKYHQAKVIEKSAVQVSQEEDGSPEEKEEDEGDEDAYLGPTQQVTIKGLFD